MNIINVDYKWEQPLSYGNNPKMIVLHHAAMDGSAEDVHRVHLKRGWAGIGYHYYIRKDGTICKGRPDNAIGAHCEGHNKNTLGICAEGNFEIETMSDVQKNSIIELVKYLCGKYGIKDIRGHRELKSTACPGRNYPIYEIKNVYGGGIMILKKGMKGPEVKKLQEDLIKLGYDLGRWGADSDFGEATENAVRKFQLDNGLVVDGIAGPKTLGKIAELLQPKSVENEELENLKKEIEVYKSKIAELEKEKETATYKTLDAERTLNDVQSKFDKLVQSLKVIKNVLEG